MSTKAIHAKVSLPNSQCGGAMNSQAFGTWQAKKGEVYAAVKKAIQAGYRTIDCAKIYRNQDEIGVAISECIAEGACLRRDLFIISKVWNTDHAPEAVAASTKRTIADLQCEYLDLLLIHWPTPWVHPAGGVDDMSDAALFPKEKVVAVDGKEIEIFAAAVPVAEQTASNVATYAAMERLVGAGLVRDIGLSNFSEAEVQAILDVAKIKPAALQIELHPALPQEALRDFCHKAGIIIMSYCPLAIGMGDPNAAFLMNNAELQAIARKEYNDEETNPVALCARMLLQWNSQLGCICLSKSVTPSRIEANASVPFGGLSAETMTAIKEWGAREGNQLRVCCPPFRPSGVSVFPDAEKIGWFAKSKN